MTRHPTIRLLVLGCLLALLYPSASSAALLTTPGLLSSASSTPACVAVNVRTRRLTVTVELRDDMGTLLGSTDCSSLSKDQMCMVSAPTHDGGVYCRFITPSAAIFEGTPEKFAATMMMVDANGDVTSAVVGRVEDNR